MQVKKVWKKLIFRKEEFDVLFHTWLCVDSEEEYEDDLFANINYNQVINQYREKHNIPFPEDIKAIREQYHLPAIKMSRVLGLGDNTYRQYEGGEIPTQANARLIQMAADPKKFLEMLQLSDLQDEKQAITAKNNAEKLLNKKNAKEDAIREFLFGRRCRTRFTGYSLPDFNKFSEMIVFFCADKNAWKTKLNKLLFYADFTFYKYHGISISGAKYHPIDMGPVPDNFNSIYELLVSKDILKVDYITFPDGGVGEKYTSERDFNESAFNPDELKILQTVKKKLKNTSAQEIIELSHQEKAWSENKNYKSRPIDYRFAYELLLF
ncbi:MAG TPA: type II toxin-antitoxin system antitoxin SocA domain-containing protein [Chitinispirillaceae bacterium]|nr:type II toxin-antitoxin system antitoxin SocA domain-containing protein [Chitinispirillaceae bacterium]